MKDTFVLLPPEDLDPEVAVEQIEQFVDRNPDLEMTMIIDDPPTRVVAVIVLADVGENVPSPLGWTI